MPCSKAPPQCSENVPTPHLEPLQFSPSAGTCTKTPLAPSLVAYTVRCCQTNRYYGLLQTIKQHRGQATPANPLGYLGSLGITLHQGLSERRLEGRGGGCTHGRRSLGPHTPPIGYSRADSSPSLGSWPVLPDSSKKRVHAVVDRCLPLQTLKFKSSVKPPHQLVLKF